MGYLIIKEKSIYFHESIYQMTEYISDQRVKENFNSGLIAQNWAMAAFFKVSFICFVRSVTI